MQTIKVKNTHNLKLAGQPSLELKESATSSIASVMPSAVPYLKPGLSVKVGDSVKIGSPLFFHKKDKRIQFLSPASGKVADIVFGERRAIERVVIEKDGKNTSLEMPTLDANSLATTSREDLVNKLLQNGLWPCLRAFPFRKIADPDSPAPAIYVSLDDDEPFKPQSSVYLEGRLDSFRFGIEVLKKLSDKVIVSAAKTNKFAKEQLSDIISVEMSGDYPANEPGVVLYHHKTSAESNTSWYINAQDVLRIGEAFDAGVYPTQRVIVVAGSLAQKRQHYRVSVGDAFSDIVEGVLPTDRPYYYIAGGVFTGRRTTEEGAIGFYDDAIHIIPANEEGEFFRFFKLGLDKPGYTRTFLAGFLPQKDNQFTAALNGSDRDCICCGLCPQVCPVDLLPQYIFKNLKGDDIEGAMGLGLLDCTQCGLCTYVCPSKIELDTAFSNAKQGLDKELAHE